MLRDAMAHAHETELVDFIFVKKVTVINLHKYNGSSNGKELRRVLRPARNKR